PESPARHVLLEWIAYLIRRYRNLLHPNFVAIVDGRGAAQRQQQHRGDTRLVGSDAACDAWLVMIAEHPIGPSTLRQRRLVFLDELGDRTGTPRGAEEAEIEWEMQAA